MQSEKYICAVLLVQVRPLLCSEPYVKEVTLCLIYF